MTTHTTTVFETPITPRICPERSLVPSHKPRNQPPQTASQPRRAFNDRAVPTQARGPKRGRPNRARLGAPRPSMPSRPLNHESSALRWLGSPRLHQTETTDGRLLLLGGSVGGGGPCALRAFVATETERRRNHSKRAGAWSVLVRPEPRWGPLSSFPFLLSHSLVHRWRASTFQIPPTARPTRGRVVVRKGSYQTTTTSTGENEILRVHFTLLPPRPSLSISWGLGLTSKKPSGTHTTRPPAPATPLVVSSSHPCCPLTDRSLPCPPNPDPTNRPRRRDARRACVVVSTWCGAAASSGAPFETSPAPPDHAGTAGGSSSPHWRVNRRGRPCEQRRRRGTGASVGERRAD